jgi:hypothetical protein
MKSKEKIKTRKKRAAGRCRGGSEREMVGEAGERGVRGRWWSRQGERGVSRRSYGWPEE